MEKRTVNQIHEKQHNSIQTKVSSSPLLVYSRRRTFHNLPEELLIEILKRLPVTSLLRFMCVCKSWYSLITTPSFISLHLSHKLNPTSNICNSTIYSFKFQVYLHNFDEPLQNWTKIDSVVGFEKSSIVGNFDGVIVLFNDWCNGYGPLVLWNPSIRKAFLLPLPFPSLKAHNKTTIVGYFPNFIFGFGFDPISKDYKVVRVFYKWDVATHVTYFYVDVTNLNDDKDGWRSFVFSANTSTLAIEHRGVCVNGVIHWISRFTAPGNAVVNTVLTFSLATEEMGVIRLPNPLSSFVLLSIKFVEDKLAVSCTGDESNIWVMEEYGVHKSWRKLLGFHLGDNVGKVLGATVMRDGKIVVTTSVGNSISWNPSNQELKNTTLPFLDPDYVDAYVPSLVLLRFNNKAQRFRELSLVKEVDDRLKAPQYS